jgi:hypothetical protein
VEYLQGSGCYYVNQEEDGLQNVKAIAEDVPHPQLRIRFNPVHMPETNLPLLSVRNDPHSIYLLLTSPSRMKGGCKCNERQVRLTWLLAVLVVNKYYK